MVPGPSQGLLPASCHLSAASLRSYLSVHLCLKLCIPFPHLDRSWGLGAVVTLPSQQALGRVGFGETCLDLTPTLSGKGSYFPGSSRREVQLYSWEPC